MSFADNYRKILCDCSLECFATPELAEKFEYLYHALVETNEKMNLTAITDEEGVITRHFADCLRGEKYIGDAKTVLDVGCGGGFPTLPLAIVRPDCAFTALDSTAKKLTFVDDMAKKMDLNVFTVAERAEELAAKPGYREKFDLVTSRAVARLSVLSELTIPFVKLGGHFVALKGSDGLSELQEAEKGITILGGQTVGKESFDLPGAGGRVIVDVKKVKPTSDTYPRNFGQIKKKPLGV